MSVMEWLPITTVSTIEAGCLYIAHGINLVLVHGVNPDGTCTCAKGARCEKPGKHPVFASWQKKKYETVEAFRDAVAAKSVPANFNIGIVMGPQPDGRDYLAIDIDDEERFAALVAVLGPLPSTLASRSGGGGAHFILTLGPGQDAGRLKNRTGLRFTTEKQTPGVDVRWKGGQIVVCPSLHESGERYSWSERLEIAEIPHAWFELIADEIDGGGGGGKGKGGGSGGGKMPSGSNVVPIGDRYIDRYIENLIANTADKIAGGAKGERNTKLWTKSCTVFEHLAGARLPFSKALAPLHAAGVASGLGRAEVEDTLAKAERHVRATGATRTPGPLLRLGGRGGVVGNVGPARAGPEAARESRAAGEPEGAGGAAPSGSSGAGPGASGGGVGAEEGEPPWELNLARSGSGAVKNTLGNTCLVVRNDAWFRGRLTYNQMRITPCVDTRPLRDPDLALWREQIEKRWGFAPGAETIATAVLLIADESTFHPVQSYLKGLTWEGGGAGGAGGAGGGSLIARVASEVLGIKHPDVLTQRMIRCWFISAVARALRPGCKVDTALVLAGDQGFKKSTFFAVLGGEWFSDSYVDVRTKDGVLQVHAAWIYEWSEIDRVTTKVGSSDVKAFITIAKDDVRPPYGRGVVSQPRSGVIVGSTNKKFLDDDTGSRRFHPVQVNQLVNVGLLRVWRDQLWAEAVVALLAGEEWWLTEDEEVLRETAAADHAVENPWLDKIEVYLRHPARRIAGVTTTEVVVGALGIDTAKLQPGDLSRAGRALRRLDWVPRQETRHMVRGIRVYYHRSTVYEVDEQPAHAGGGPECDGSESAKAAPSQLPLDTQVHTHIREAGDTSEGAQERAHVERAHDARTIPGAIGKGGLPVAQNVISAEISTNGVTRPSDESLGYTAEPGDGDE